MRSPLEKACDFMSSKTSRILNWAFTERGLYNLGTPQHDPSLTSMYSPLKNKNVEMYGLIKFISGTRKCQSREDEDKLINNELAKIRNQFQKRTLDGYSKRKYVCKLLFMFLMGRNIDFGHSEALSLLSSNVRCEKQMGYLFLSILFDTKSDTIHLLIRCIKFDLESGNWDCMDLAIKCIANIGNKEMAVEFAPTLLSLMEENHAPDSVVQSALLCYLKLYRASGDIKTPDICKMLSLLTHRDLGVVLCATTLIDALVKGSRDYNENEIVRIVVTELWRVISHSRVGLRADYVQNRIMPAPWLLINLLRLLQNFTIPKEPPVRKMLNNVVDIIMVRTQEPHVSTIEVRGRYNVRHCSPSAIYLKYAVFFEAVNVITQNTDSFELWSRASPMMEQILATNLPNLKYMAFETMGRLAISETGRTSMKSYKQKALDSLKNDVDVSIQHKAVNFLYSICDQSNVDSIVGELLDFLHDADYTIKESIALQVAIIADHWLPNYSWYVDAMFKLIAISGDNIDDQVYSKVIRTVTGIKEVQKHATFSAFHYLNASVHSETLVRLAGFILGEFGYLINDIKGSSAAVQWKLLHSKFAYSDSYTKSTLLSSFMKIAHKFPEMRYSAAKIFKETAQSGDVEIQNRSVEYLKLLEANFDQSLLSEVFREMPPFKDGVLRIVSQQIDSLSTFNQGDGDFGVGRRDVLNTRTKVQLRSHDDDESQYPLRNYFMVSNDERLKINMKSEYRGHSGKLIITYLNKKQSTVSIDAQISQQIFDSKLGLSISPIPKLLDMGMEVEQTIYVECFGIFNVQPTLDISITYMEGEYGGQQRFEKESIKLPVFVNNFLEPADMRRDDFFHKWNALEAVSLSCREETFEPKDPMAFMDINRTVWKLGRFNIQVVELSSNRVLGAATFVSASSTAICLLRLDSDVSKPQFRLAIKSADPTLTAQVMSTLKNVL